jgi:tRNA nucleotidyltransferase (CCA-adding enzyme)
MIDILPPALAQVLRETPELRDCFLVGGCVRDWLLGVPVKDFDIEVYGLDYDALVRALRRWGRADLVGRSFGVVKLNLAGEIHDFSLPRRDSKTGSGHRGFTVAVDPTIATRDAAARRDFTINALMWNPRTAALVDHFGGERDLRDRVLRHTTGAFAEDPLRVLRGMQFAGRFQLTTAPETIAICASIRDTYRELPLERVREEWFKWATRSREPSRGLALLQDTGWLAHFPELAALIDVPQDPEWHPEGDVWTHTNHCVDALVRLPGWQSADDSVRRDVMLATLLHDSGKATHTHRELRDGRERIVSPGHEIAGAELAAQFLERIGSGEPLIARVAPLVRNHMLLSADPSPRAIRRLAVRLAPATIDQLGLVMTADAAGRPPRPARVPHTVTALLRGAAELEIRTAAPKPILLGRHLLERGWSPGPDLGQVLKRAFEAQLDGDFQDLVGALEWLSRQGS